MTETQTTAVSRSITVDAPINVAFAVFTEDMASWWPTEHHILQAPLTSVVFEPRVGGRVYDVGEDGTECQWARVLVHEPPRRVVFSWDISPRWEIESDRDRTSEVEVRFIAEGPDRTRVELEHRHLDRHGDGWEDLRGAVESPGGWDLGLQRYGRHVELSTVAGG